MKIPSTICGIADEFTVEERKKLPPWRRLLCQVCDLIESVPPTYKIGTREAVNENNVYFRLIVCMEQVMMSLIRLRRDAKSLSLETSTAATVILSQLTKLIILIHRECPLNEKSSYVMQPAHNQTMDELKMLVKNSSADVRALLGDVIVTAIFAM